MLKLLIFIVGLVLGAAGATSWLLGEPGSGSRMAAPAGSPGEALQNVEAQVRAAIAQGEVAGREKEAHLRRRLETLRHDPNAVSR